MSSLYLVKSNAASFPAITQIAPNLSPIPDGKHYFQIPSNLSAPLGVSKDVLVCAQREYVRHGDLVLFQPFSKAPWMLGRIFKLDGWYLRDESNKSRIYPINDVKNPRKVLEHVDILTTVDDALSRLIAPVKKTRKRREFSHLSAKEAAFFDQDILDEVRQ